jgi:DNA-binding CsgD family transcriptional regulator
VREKSIVIAIEAFSELLQILYSAPLQQGQWQEFLTLLCDHTRSRGGIYLSASVRYGTAALAVGGHHDLAVAQAIYNQKHAASDPLRAPLIRAGKSGVYTDDELLPNDGLMRTDMYQELGLTFNLRHATVSVINISLRQIEAFTIWRSPEEGPMAPDARRLLELVIPHVRISLEIGRKLGVAQQQLAGAQAMADASATATFLLTRRGRIEHCNAAAQALLRENDGLTFVDGQVAASEGQSRATLAFLLQNASIPSNPLAEACCNRALSLPRPSGKASLQLLACPMPPAQRKDAGADLMLLVTDPEKSVNFPDDMLRALYKLSSAETEIANGLLMGYSAEEMASLRRVAVGTVRQQIKSMMDKTGTSRQTDMVRLFMALPRVPNFG